MVPDRCEGDDKIWVGLGTPANSVGWIGLGSKVGGLGWIGSRKMDPRPSLIQRKKFPAGKHNEEFVIIWMHWELLCALHGVEIGRVRG